MSRENADRLRAALEAFGREGPEAILDEVDPDVEWITDRADMGRVVYRGHEGIVRWYTDLSEGFDEYGLEVDRVIDSGNRVVALGRMYGRGRTTGIRAEIPMAIVFTLGSDAKVVRYESFRNPAEALEAVGLRD